MRALGLSLLVMASLLPAQESAHWPQARMILEKHCVRCHMPAKARGDLDLSTRAGLLRGGKHGSAYDAAKPAESTLLAFVRGDEKPRMPWKEDPLSEGDQRVLEQWLLDGAPMPTPLTLPRVAGAVTDADRAHWAFQPLRAVALPAGAQHPIDALVDATLSARGLKRAARADAATLVRRAHLLVTGLLPEAADAQSAPRTGTAGEWAAFVDQLLASPRFGERMARHWLDVARYADSNGYEFDEERPHAWPYRDFVIRAMNEDMPADQFVRWQVAGDELAPADRWARAATGFLAAGPVNGNENNEGTRAIELDDVLSTTSSAFLGLSMGCARCHDHKFDPLPTADYYGMLAAFSTTRRTESVFVDAEVEKAAADALAQHERAVRERTTALEEFLNSARARADRAGQKCEEPQWRYSFEEPPAEWLLPDFDDAAWKSGAGGFGTQGTPGAVIGTEWNTPRIWMRREFQWEGDAGDLAIVAHHDDSVNVYLNGTLLCDARGYVTEYGELHVTDFGREKLRQGRNVLSVFCTQDSGGQFIDVRPVRRSRLRVRTPRDLALEGRNADPDAGLNAEDCRRRDELADALSAAKRRRPRPLPRALHLHDHAAQPDTTFLLRRGNPEDKAGEVAFTLPQVLPGGGPSDAWLRRAAMPEGAQTTGRRAALAAWLTDAQQGAGALVARVLANRVWQWHFGAGLVGTPNDFGMQGARPAHPEVLEWLAQELVHSGWSLKHLHRVILTSETWRQACGTAAEGADADGALLSHRRLLRLDGETLRDVMLQTSGVLNLAMGGPAVKPWVHDDAIATGSTEKWPRGVKDGPHTWRRSVYVFMRRSVRFPLFECFDAPDAQASCGARVPTVTPLQSLALMNNAFVGAQAALFARSVGQSAGTDAAAFAQAAMRRAWAREPRAEELAAATAFLREAGAEQRQSLCQALFSSNAFLYID